jgi:small GTP-binding protein
MTIGLDFHLKDVKLGGKNVSLQIWDFAGEERFRSLISGYVKGSSGGIFMYDITRYTTLTIMDEWLDLISQGLKNSHTNIPIVLVGGKADLEEIRAVPKEEAIKLGKLKELYGFIECSSKTGQNVESIFAGLARAMMENVNLI